MFLPLLALAPFAPAESVLQDPVQDELARLRARVEVLEKDGPQRGSVSLEDDQLDSVAGFVSDDPLARAWYDNFELSGFVAAGFFDSGGTGFVPNGEFLVDQATVYVDVEVAAGVSALVEVQYSRFKYDYDKDVRTGEVFAYVHDFCGVGIKVGRFDLPFGEEYFWVDAPANPLITPSAAQVYGEDEGVLVHGKVSDLRWFAAVTAGSNRRSNDDDPGKLVTARLSGGDDAWSWSASAARTGDAAENPFLLGGKPMKPVGEGFASTAGVSPSSKVDTTLWELDTSFELGDRAETSLMLGQALLDDEVSTFDRDLTWFTLQQELLLSPDLSATLRYSEVGTYDDDEGYMIDGMFHGSGRDLGYDTKRLQRLAFGLQWRFRPRVAWKVEVGRDHFQVIDGSPFDPQNNDRLYAAFELVASF